MAKLINYKQICITTTTTTTVDRILSQLPGWLQVVCFHLTWQHGKTLKCKTRAPKQQQHSPKNKSKLEPQTQNCVALFTFATHTDTHAYTHREADSGFVARQVIRRRVPATLQARRTI